MCVSDSCRDSFDRFLASDGRHLCDLQDHVDTGLESLAGCVVWSDELMASYRRYGEYRQDKCLLLFSLTEMFLMPGMFLGGCYGMNWEDDAWFALGIGYWYSYPAWWAIVLVIFLAMFIYFRSKKII